jgi:hypothetical protein
MPALFGYLVAVSLLLGGAYAGLQWLSAPEAFPTEKTAAHNSNAPDKSAPLRMSGTATGHQASGGNSASADGGERSNKVDHEPKPAEQPSALRGDSKLRTTDNVPRGCAPIGLTASGDLVFSMQCQEMIDRHRRESASSEIATAAPDTAVDPAAPSTKSSEGNADTAKDRELNVAAQPADHPANRPATDSVASDETRSRNQTNSDMEHHGTARKPGDGRAALPGGNDARPPQQGRAANGESRAAGFKPETEATSGMSAKQKRMARTKSQSVSRTVERRDASEQRPAAASSSRRVAARAGDSDLWYNVLGLR